MGYLSLDWNVNKFHLPDDKNVYKKIFTNFQLLKGSQFKEKVISDEHDSIFLVYDSFSNNE